MTVSQSVLSSLREQQSSRVEMSKNNKSTKSGKQTLLKQFNSIQAVQFINMGQMDVNKPYRVTGIKKTKFEFGTRVCVELDHKEKLCLPERYNLLKDEEIEEIRNGNFCLINRGTEGKGKMKPYKLELTPVSKHLPPPLPHASAVNLTQSTSSSRATAAAGAQPPPPPPPPPSSSAPKDYSGASAVEDDDETDIDEDNDDEQQGQQGQVDSGYAAASQYGFYLDDGDQPSQYFLN